MRYALIFALLLSLAANGYLLGRVGFVDPQQQAGQASLLRAAPLRQALNVGQLDTLDGIVRFAHTRSVNREAQRDLIEQQLWADMLAQPQDVSQIIKDLQELNSNDALYRFRLSEHLSEFLNGLSEEQKQGLREAGKAQGYFQGLGLSWR